MIVPNFLIEAVNKGVEVTMRRDAEHGIGFDVNTQAKSEIVIYPNGVGGWVAHMRYNEKEDVEDFRDLATKVRHAMHGRDFVNPAWIGIMLEMGIIKKTVATTTVVTYT